MKWGGSHGSGGEHITLNLGWTTIQRFHESTVKFSLIFFQSFGFLFMDQENGKGSTLRALDWYLQSNVSAPHIGTILTFAALEAFSFLLLKDGEDSKKKKGKRISDRERIERALSNMQVPPGLPKSCESLRVLKDWDTGPTGTGSHSQQFGSSPKGLGRCFQYGLLGSLASGSMVLRIDVTE